MRLLPITVAVLREAARLRATFPALRTPDAIPVATAVIPVATAVIPVATAVIYGCALFVTNNMKLAQITGLPVAILDVLLAS